MASYEEDLDTISRPAGADLSTKQYFGVKLNSSGQAVLAGDGEAAIGILQDKPAAAGRAACIAVGGVSKVAAGGTIAAGARFQFDSAGKAVAIATGSAWSMGIAIEAMAAGGIYPALLQPVGPTV